MSTYTPDSWTILRMTTPEETVYKVLCSWYGSFDTGDSWKVSSGITGVIEHKDYYELPQHSGSSYYCGKSSCHMSGIMYSMLSSWQEQVKERGGMSIEAISVEHFIDEWYHNEG